MDFLSMQHGDIFMAFFWSCAQLFVLIEISTYSILESKSYPESSNITWKSPSQKIFKTWPFRDSHPTAYLSLLRSTFCKVLLSIFSSYARRYLFFAWLSSASLVIFIFSFIDRAFWNFAIFSWNEKWPTGSETNIIPTFSSYIRCLGRLGTLLVQLL